MDVLTYARQLMIAQAKALGVDVLEPKHRDLPPDAIDPDATAHEIAAALDYSAARLAIRFRPYDAEIMPIIGLMRQAADLLEKP